MNTSLKIKHIVLAVMALGSATLSQAQTQALAPTGAATVQRDVRQEARIEQGLKNGQLSTGEAAKLQKEEARVERLQARSLKDGHVSPVEQQKLTQAQNKVSQDIHAAKNNAVKGDPNSASSRRLQADVQRHQKQQARIQQGLQSGSLSQHEAATLERGQSRANRREAKAGQDGYVSAREQRRIQRAQGHQSRRIHRQKHDA